MNASAQDLRLRLQDRWEICVSPTLCAVPAGGEVVYEERVVVAPERRRVEATVSFGGSEATAVAMAEEPGADVIVGGLIAGVCAVARLPHDERAFELPATALQDATLLLVGLVDAKEVEFAAALSEFRPAQRLEAALTQRWVQGWRCESR